MPFLSKYSQCNVFLSFRLFNSCPCISLSPIRTCSNCWQVYGTKVSEREWTRKVISTFHFFAIDELYFSCSMRSIGLPGFRRKNMALQALEIVRIGKEINIIIRKHFILNVRDYRRCEKLV